VPFSGAVASHVELESEPFAESNEGVENGLGCLILPLSETYLVSSEITDMHCGPWQDMRGANLAERENMALRKRCLLVGSVVGMMALLPFSTAAVAAPTGAQATLTAVNGTGSGQVLIAPTAKDHGTFAVEITINVHGANPDTVYTVSRNPDLNPDGNCSGGSIDQPPVTLVTSAGGAGAVHFELHRGEPFLSGTRFDVKFVLASDALELQSECVTVTVK
jgi:hypothetical protein